MFELKKERPILVKEDISAYDGIEVVSTDPHIATILVDSLKDYEIRRLSHVRPIRDATGCTGYIGVRSDWLDKNYSDELNLKIIDEIDLLHADLSYHQQNRVYAIYSEGKKIGTAYGEDALLSNLEAIYFAKKQSPANRKKLEELIESTTF